MRTILMIFLPLLLVGCDNTAHEAVRHKIPAVSLAGWYIATYKIDIDDELAMSSPEGLLRITAADEPANQIRSLAFDISRYRGDPPQGAIIPKPGSLKSIVSPDYIAMTVDGNPYDGSFEKEYKGVVSFYGDKEETIYENGKEFRGVNIRLKGWMKERQYYYDEYGSASFDCEITIEFTVEDHDYKIVITDAENMRIGY